MKMKPNNFHAANSPMKLNIAARPWHCGVMVAPDRFLHRLGLLFARYSWDIPLAKDAELAAPWGVWVLAKCVRRVPSQVAAATRGSIGAGASAEEMLDQIALLGPAAAFSDEVQEYLDALEPTAPSLSREEFGPEGPGRVHLPLCHRSPPSPPTPAPHPIAKPLRSSTAS